MKRMGNIQRIDKYIKDTQMPLELSNRYQLDPEDLITIVRSCRGNAYGAALRAFIYGQAKGYRAGRSEAKRHG